jgi:broad specificity phosphatase PhoE
MTIFLVRHGETEWNRERRHQGRFDSPLTERGIAQAHAIGILLRRLPDAAAAPIVASPQGRARHSAGIVRAALRRTGPLSIDERLREHSVGAWDGLTYREIEAAAPGIFDGEGAYAWYFHPFDSETYAAFAARLGEWLGEQDEAAPLIVVAHGLVSRVLRGLYAHLPYQVALTLPVPQDKIFRLAGGAIEAIAAAPVAGKWPRAL